MAASPSASKAPARSAPESVSKRVAPPSRRASDDEILGLTAARQPQPQGAAGGGPTPLDSQDGDRLAAGEFLAEASPAADREPPAADASAEPENLRAVFEKNPEMRRAWQDAAAYRDSFATPEEARAATALLADLDRMDALFFSRRPEDHAALARAVESLDPAAFASLAEAMAAHAANRSSSSAPRARAVIPNVPTHPGAEESAVDPELKNQIPRRPQNGLSSDDNPSVAGAATQAQTEFFHSANAAAVESVLETIESQVERLLPEGMSKNARNRVVGEIYRELDSTLRANRQLAGQMREIFRSGALDAAHERSIVSLITSRARQALPGVAKRVLGEWTSMLVAANQERQARQSAAQRRVDIAGSGGAANDGRRPLAPRDLDYARLSDSDILNL